MIHSLKIIFAGTPDFAALHLETLITAEYDIAAVITQPDMPAGRGQKLKPTPVKEVALLHNIRISQPKTLKDKNIQDEIKEINPDVIIDVACGLLVPKEILEMPRFGCINVHPSLLPRWRGTSPIQRAILADDKETGISIMQMDEGYDTGPVLYQVKCLIDDTDTTQTLHNRLAQLGIAALLEVLSDLANYISQAKKQDETAACYAKKIEKADAAIDWNKTALALDREIRAYNPWPISFAEIDGQTVRIWQAMPLSYFTDQKPGTIVRLLKDGIDVATSQGILRILKMQFPGGKILSAADVLNSKKDFFKAHKIFGRGIKK